jgi:hypothetical protein
MPALISVLNENFNMLRRNRFFTMLLLSLMASTALADSPLTSTNIAQAYANEQLVQDGMACKGNITPELCLKLNEKAVPIALKIAAINAVSWVYGEYAGNAEQFLSVNSGTNGFASLEELLEHGTAHQLICYAYLRALDDYDDVTEALAVAAKALERAPGSLAIAMIHGLIKAQHAFGTDWCLVYESTNQVRQQRSRYNYDFSAAAMAIIFKYMDLYEDDCD